MALIQYYAQQTLAKNAKFSVSAKVAYHELEIGERDRDLN